MDRNIDRCPRRQLMERLATSNMLDFRITYWGRFTNQSSFEYELIGANMNFIKINEEELNKENFQPLTVIFTLIIFEDKYLLIRNSESLFWELPVIKKMESETPADASIRMCKDLLNLDEIDIIFEGVAKIIFEKRFIEEYFAIYLYNANVSIFDKFDSSDENMNWYSKASELKPICSTSRQVIEFVESSKLIIELNQYP